MVKLLFYCSRTTTHKFQRLSRAVTQVAGGEDIEICITLTSLFPGLKAYSSASDLAVLVAVTPAELERFYHFRDILQHMDIILIVPDNKKATMHKGSHLFPRFITSVENDFLPIESVLKKMIQRSHLRNLKARTNLKFHGAPLSR